MPARVVVLAGPSGSGKSHLASRLGLPVVRLDDFYKDGDDPTLPFIDLPGGEPIVDWDDPGSWDGTAAIEALVALCQEGRAEVPTYDITRSARSGRRTLVLGEARLVVAEGIFAQEVVGSCRERGVLADAICLTQSPLLTFTRRLSRDLAENRKPPWVLVRRGLHLLREQDAIVRHAEAAGCRVMGPSAAYAEVRALTTR